MNGYVKHFIISHDKIQIEITMYEQLFYIWIIFPYTYMRNELNQEIKEKIF